MNHGIIGTLSDEMRAYSKSSKDQWENEEDIDKMFPHSLKKLKNKPYLTDAEQYMIDHQIYHGKGIRKKHKSKKKKKK